ncbi:MAG: DEAD/DEAH box helicase, partial [Eubacterium sp.]|nr:DEAD/DEAH box helicase [Eubacterium sp.]
DIHSNQLVERRMDIFRRLSGGESLTIVACFEALLEKLIPFQAFRSECLVIDYSSIIEPAAFRRKLVEMGYESCGMVEKPGDFSTRGSIIDIFPLTEDAPVRIELWDEEVDSIRSFDVDSQRSIEKLDSISIYPASDMILTQSRIQEAIRRMREDYKEREIFFKSQKKNKEKERLRKMVMAATTDLDSYGTALGNEALLSYFYEETESLLDYLPGDTLIFLDEPARSLSRGRGNEEEFLLSMEQRLEGGYILPGQADLIYSFDHILGRLAGRSMIYLSELAADCREIPARSTHFIHARSIFSYHNNFEQLIKDLKNWKKEKYRTILMSSSRTRAKRLAEDLRDYELNAYYATDYDRSIVEGEIMVVPGRLSGGFEYPDIRFAVLTEKDIFKEKKKKRTRRYAGYGGQKIEALSDLNLGDYVVHERYGLGIYRGIESIETDGATKDYICIEYQDNSNYLFPASQLEMIQKYASGSARKPKLNKLNSPEWKKTKNRVRSRIQIAAKDLVDLYASRQTEQGFCFGEDTVWQREFEELFPYEETEDQLNAIEDTKSDMESPRIMDRLICGDVGYGKTEVAIRASFKAVQDSRQVALLVPTTILAQQHYNSFRERMERYPVEIRMLSRFCSPKETREIQEGLKKGSVDIVIGTHKLLSSKVQFKQLGLLIIDEEQRFGVKQKEKIKQIKKNVDVLALSATPIPRTLHMSLAGIRDMSLLEIPPVDRRAIQTYV